MILHKNYVVMERFTQKIPAWKCAVELKAGQSMTKHNISVVTGPLTEKQGFAKDVVEEMSTTNYHKKPVVTTKSMTQSENFVVMVKHYITILGSITEMENAVAKRSKNLNYLQVPFIASKL